MTVETEVTEPEVTETPESTEPEKTALDAFDEGLKEDGSEATVESDELEPPKEPEPQEPESDKSEKPEGEPEKAEKPKDDKPVEEEKDPAVEEEIQGFGLKEKAAERFRDMSKEIKELKAAAEEVEPLREKAEQYDQMVESWNSVEATPEQIQTAQAIMGAVNSGDPDKIIQVAKAYRQAADALEADLGIKKADGSLDPDLQQQVEEYGLAPELAAEIQQNRELAKQREQYGKRQAQTQQQQIQQQQAVQQGVAEIEALNGELSAADPDFERKLPYLQPALEQIRDHLPPNQWAQAVREAYSRIPDLPKAPVETHQPLRPQGTGAPMQQAPKSAADAFDVGLGLTPEA